MLTRLRGHWQLAVLVVLVAALWQTPVAQPLRILIVFLHELSHAFAVIVTGGEVLELTVNSNEGGMVMSRGGNRFVTLSAGYVGSLLIGVMLFVAAVRTHLDRAVLGVMGVVMVMATLLYGQGGFALLFGLAAGAVLIAVAWFLPRDASDLILRVIGLASMIYVPLDIYSDTIARAHLRSDARMLAEEFGGATLLWGGVWLLISLVVIALCLWFGLGRDSNMHWRGPVDHST